MKMCARCGTEKSAKEFRPSRRHGDGRYPYCQACSLAYMKKYRVKDREKNKKRSREWYEKNRERAIARTADWQKRNIEATRRHALETYRRAMADPVRKAKLRRTRNAYYAKYRASPIVQASVAVRAAVYCGLLKRLPCEVCGDEKVQAHHHKGYELSVWFNVQWLCPKHHREAHGKNHWG